MGRKGFTFVELAIVPVIIGTIMGMAIKGKALIDVTQTRSDIRKIDKIETAVASMVAKTDPNGSVTNFTKLTSSFYDTAAFVNADMLTSKDFEIQDNAWKLQNCSKGAANVTANTLGTAYTLESICLVITMTNNKLTCNIEKMLDDSGVKNGFGRSSTATIPATATAVNTAAYNYLLF